MMKKLSALVLALLLLAAPALAESALLNQIGRIREQKLLDVICEVLTNEELIYEKDEEYVACFLSVDLTTPSVLGDYTYISVSAYEDGVNIIASYAEVVPDAHQDELIRLCHHLSSWTYLGKFYVDPVYDELCYEIFIPMDALDVREYDRELIADYLWTAVSVLDGYQEYFLMVINDGESANNVFAMWEADMD